MLLINVSEQMNIKGHLQMNMFTLCVLVTLRDGGGGGGAGLVINFIFVRFFVHPLFSEHQFISSYKKGSQCKLH